MGREKVKLEYITDDLKRKVSFRKRKENVVKKTSELNVFCDVDAAAIIYSGRSDSHPQVWPDDRGVHRFLDKYHGRPVLEKTLNQEGLIHQRLLKEKEYLKKRSNENHEEEISQLMINYMAGHADPTMVSENALHLKMLVEQNLKEIDRVMEASGKEDEVEKVKLEYITDDLKRKVSFRKRKENIVKKTSELNILCDVDAAAIIYSGCSDSRPQVWPDDGGVHRFLEKYHGRPVLGKTLNQEGLIHQRLLKEKEYLKKRSNENREEEISQLMINYMGGYADPTMVSENALHLKMLVEENLKEIDRVMEASGEASGKEDEVYVPAPPMLGALPIHIPRFGQMMEESIGFLTSTLRLHKEKEHLKKRSNENKEEEISQLMINYMGGYADPTMVSENALRLKMLVEQNLKEIDRVIEASGKEDEMYVPAPPMSEEGLLINGGNENDQINLHHGIESGNWNSPSCWNNMEDLEYYMGFGSSEMPLAFQNDNYQNASSSSNPFYP
ncbi:agamous-like MADS-box protein AGL80 [Senna tora]|uniref:Agamous-like MADS-box protein AGL80 n=1 Tax=Senna tora TaxID=362788 RepID=A0A834TEC3_9FABA|nr:agamous-like MADS-box protein AGL80 [Senna tora]